MKRSLGNYTAKSVSIWAARDLYSVVDSQVAHGTSGDAWHITPVMKIRASLYLQLVQHKDDDVVAMSLASVLLPHALLIPGRNQ